MKAIAMNKILLALAASLVMTSLASAADADRTKAPRRAAPPAAAASAAPVAPVRNAAASVPQGPRHNERKTEIDRQHARGARMGQCQKEAADQALGGVERRQFLAKCMTTP